MKKCLVIHCVESAAPTLNFVERGKGGKGKGKGRLERATTSTTQPAAIEQYVPKYQATKIVRLQAAALYSWCSTLLIIKRKILKRETLSWHCMRSYTLQYSNLFANESSYNS